MSQSLNNHAALTGCELHLHLAGSYYAADFLHLIKHLFHKIDWEDRAFLSSYRTTIDPEFDPIRLIENALQDPVLGMPMLKAAYEFTPETEADFAHFMLKYRFFSKLWGYALGQTDSALAKSLIAYRLDQHKQEGFDYVEYRCGIWGTLEEQIGRMRVVATTMQAASDETFTARYIVPIPRDDSSEMCWPAIKALLKTCPHLAETIVGIDFASIEEGYPPKLQRPFFQELRAFNAQHPNLQLDAVYHVGESYYDKSLESAIRWCHEAALLGTKRLGHCIALGLDPTVAITRRRQAHQVELVSERLDQIAYDLHYETQLRQSGIEIDSAQLRKEQIDLQKLDPTTQVDRPYTSQRLEAVRLRQQFVLRQLIKLGTVIECCPTSNLRIGGVTDAKHHPIHTFLASNVNLVICTDDPGTFDITLASEFEWIVKHTSYSPEQLRQRLGNPRRFRLGQSR